MAGTDNVVTGRGDEGSGSQEETAGPDRRHFLRYAGGLTAAGSMAGVFTGVGLLSEQTAHAATTEEAKAAADGTLAATPIRPPAAALAVRGPYLSTWLPATALPGTFPPAGCADLTFAGESRVHQRPGPTSDREPGTAPAFKTQARRRARKHRCRGHGSRRRTLWTRSSQYG